MSVLQTGTCALFFAAQGGFLDIVRVLLDSGASLDLASYVSLQWITVQYMCFLIDSDESPM